MSQIPGESALFFIARGLFATTGAGRLFNPISVLRSSQELTFMIEKSAKPVLGAVMVIGGGIAGMQSALDLADSGYYVYLVEKSPAIGGAMSQLDKTFPTNDCAM